MGKLKRIASFVMLSVAFILISVQHISSQTKPPKFKHDGKIAAKYDKTKDQTTVFLQPYIIKRSTNPVVAGVASTALAAGFIHRGKTLQSTPSTVELGILSESTLGYLYEKDRRLKIKLDDETLDVGEMKLVTSRFYQLMGNKYREDLAIRLPYEQFIRLTKAKDVHLEVGQQSFKLQDEHLEALRELASRMIP
jgi:hypothetical protein